MNEAKTLLEMTEEIGITNIIMYIVVFLFFIDKIMDLKDSLWKKMGKQTKEEMELEERKKMLASHEEAIPQLQSDITNIIASLKTLTQDIQEEQEKSDKRERNKLRDRLLQSYRYYTNPEKNPSMSWSEMEADAFWQMYGDYRDLKGNHYIETEVKPAMNHLTAIPMTQEKELIEMMHQRK